MHRLIPLAPAVVLLWLLLLLSCVTPAPSSTSPPPPPPPTTTTTTATAAASFDVLVAGVPAKCCPTCEAIALSIRNTSDTAVVVDWPASRMEHNGAAAALVVDGPEPSIGPHSTWSGLLRPKPGAPHSASLEEGRLRNGRYSISVTVRSDANVATSSIDLDIDYGAGSDNPACPPGS